MQEIHSIGGGRFFGGGGNGGGGGGGGVDRRLRPHHHHQALKCPRCDSINTKFCYYNNYNLSQPRHFCKNCRRYWTKGGVLRNVPVGGGCRKSKRANNTNNSIIKSPKNNSSSETPPEHNSNNSHSSSESSSLTATTETVSAPNNSDSQLLIPSSNPALEKGTTLEQQGTEDCAIFSEIGNFTNLITSNNDALQFGFDANTIPNTSSFAWQHQQGLTLGGADNGELKFHDNLNGGDASTLLDQGTVPNDISMMQNKTGHGGFGSLDWHGVSDQGLFDLSNTVDHSYWTQHTTHWSDHDNSTLFHLP